MLFRSRKRWLSAATRRTVATLAVAVFVIGLVVAEQDAAPFFSLFQNGIGAELDPRRSAFPEQTYDYGVREAVAAIAAASGPSAAVVSDAPAVVTLYLREYGRPDILVRALSAQGVPDDVSESWVLVQAEHATFENELLVEHLRSSEKPWREFRMDNVIAVQVFRIRGRRA